MYWYFYPLLYYQQIWAYPDRHERHWFLFLEFKKEKLRYLHYYAFFATHRFLTAFLIIGMYNYPIQQWVLIWFLNFLYFINTQWFYRECINNFFSTFNGFIQLIFSICLFLFLNSQNPDKLRIWGYVSNTFL